MKLLKSFFLPLFVLVFTTGFMFQGCESQGSSSQTNEEMAEQTQQIVGELDKQIGMPNINNGYEKKILRDIYELRDQADLQTYTYIINMHGDKIFLGKSVGYGLPASVQYSNPMRLTEDNVDLGGAWGQVKMPQPEPNGLFMPEGLSATWILLQNPETGEPEPVYLEPEILVSPFKLH